MTAYYVIDVITLQWHLQ